MVNQKLLITKFENQVRPGIQTKDEEGNLHCVPIRSRVLSMFAEHNDLQYAVPGGLIGVGTKIDPTLCIGDRLVGHVSTFNCMSNDENSFVRFYLFFIYFYFIVFF